MKGYSNSSFTKPNKYQKNQIILDINSSDEEEDDEADLDLE